MKNICRVLIASVICAIPATLLAHTGPDAGAHHGSAFVAGLLHPLTGVDHLVAMLAIGVLGAFMAQRWWLLPSVFCAVLLAGSLIGLSGLSAPVVEPAIALSVLALGLLIAMRKPLPARVMVALVSAFAFVHGVAHGEAFAQTAATPWLAVAGMLVASIALHGAGVIAGLALIKRNLWWPRSVGLGAAALGGFLLMQFA
jgi:urease accessory protein